MNSVSARAVFRSRPRPDCRTRPVLEPMESRRLLSVTVAAAINPQALSVNATRTIDLFPNFTDPTADNVATLTTDQGTFQMQLFNQQTPRTVANFVQLADSGEYNGTIVHRSLAGFVVQLGGYTPAFTHIPVNGPVINEPGISNTIGTVAMAKLGGKASSATSEFFVNTGDNSANLDTQNVGFTVFGQVINGGIAVVNQINNLPTTTVQGFSNVPVKTTPPSIPSALVNVQSVSVAPQFTFAVANTNPGAVTAQLNGEQLVLTSGAQAGTANITVTATDTNGHAEAQTFAVTVGTLDVPIGAGHATQTVKFTAAGGGGASVGLKGGGAATLTFSGSNLAATTRGLITTVTGSGIQIANIATTDTGGGTTLTMTGNAEIDGFSADAGLKQISGTAATLIGNMTINGTVGKLALKSASHGKIALGGSTATLATTAITLGTVQDEDLVSDAPLKSISVGSWTGTTSVVPLVNAPALASLTAKGDFTASLDLGFQGSSGALQGDLGTAKVGGTLGAGRWRVLGNTKSITAGSIPAGWSGQISGNLSALTVSRAFNGNLNANTVGVMKVGGAVSGSTINLAQAFGSGDAALKSLTINGAATGLTLIANANLGAITVGSLSASTIFAGVNTGTALPTLAANFANTASLASLTVRSRGASTFVDSNVAAHNLGRLSLGSIQTANGGTSIGVAGDSIASITATDTAAHKIKLAGLTPSNVTANVAALGFGLGDFKVIVV